MAFSPGDLEYQRDFFNILRAWHKSFPKSSSAASVKTYLDKVRFWVSPGAILVDVFVRSDAFTFLLKTQGNLKFFENILGEIVKCSEGKRSEIDLHSFIDNFFEKKAENME